MERQMKKTKGNIIIFLLKKLKYLKMCQIKSNKVEIIDLELKAYINPLLHLN